MLIHIMHNLIDKGYLRGISLLILSWILWYLSWKVFPYFILVSLFPLLCFLNTKRRYKRTSPIIIFEVSLGTFICVLINTSWLIETNDVYGILANIIYSIEFTCLIFFIKFITSLRKITYSLYSYLILFLSWLSFEYLQNILEIGFPWINLGNIFCQNPLIIQWYAYTGVLGGTSWILLTNIIFYHTLSQRSKLKVSLLVLVFVLFIPPLISFVIEKDKGNSVSEAQVKNYSIAFIQTNFNHSLSTDVRLNNIIDSLYNDNNFSVDILTLPECSISQFVKIERLSKNSLFIKLKALIKSGKVKIILTGANLILNEDNRKYKLNAVLRLDNSTDYKFISKNKFVPFHEKIPEGFSFLNIPSANYDYYQSSLSAFRSFDSTSLIPVICYESIFGQICGRKIDDNRGLFFFFSSETDLGSFDSKQFYLSLSQLRAIETNRYVVRATNLGFNAVINHYGSIITKAPNSNSTKVLICKVPALSGKTFYTRYGDYMGLIAAILLGLILIFAVIDVNILKDNTENM
ncbi:MAG: hypothetical protein AAFW00_18895 [Bacteroidota bacterium]